MPGSGKNIARVLLVRNDRLGDLVLTTPAITALRQALPGARIDLLCSGYAEPLVRRNPHLNNILTDRGAHDDSDLDELVREVRSRDYDSAVVFVHSRKNARLVSKAGIPLRVGPWVRLWDPLRFNRPVRQRRSRGEKNEAGYNLDLLAPLGVVAAELPPPLVLPGADALGEAERFLEELTGVSPGTPLVGVHPGMGGSAFNWPEHRWRELIDILCEREGLKVLLTGSESERGLIERLVAGLPSGRAHPATGLGLELFIGVLARLSALAAPSTGPLHIASALGVPVAGIYSPLRAHHPRRWGPIGPGARTFLPPVDCVRELRCGEGRCGDNPCMSLIDPGEVADFLFAVVEKR